MLLLPTLPNLFVHYFGKYASFNNSFCHPTHGMTCFIIPYLGPCTKKNIAPQTSATRSISNWLMVYICGVKNVHYRLLFHISRHEGEREVSLQCAARTADDSCMHATKSIAVTHSSLGRTTAPWDLLAAATRAVDFVLICGQQTRLEPTRSTTKFGASPLVFETRVGNLDELKQRLIEVWCGLQ